MIQIGLFYLLPFIFIFIIFGKLCEKYNQKSGFKIFTALVVFFGLQIFSIITISLIILAKSKKINPESTVYEYGYFVHIFSFCLAKFVTYIYHRWLKQNLEDKLKSKCLEIENIGEK